MESLHRLIGHEKSLREVSQHLQFETRPLGAAVVGAMHLTCADESEFECVEAFQQGFVTYCLPALKFAKKSAFHLANIGARYEWGAVHLAEDHFTAAPPSTGSLLLVVKINAHVACEPASKGETNVVTGLDDLPPFRLGHWLRYGSKSAACGALAAMLADQGGPFADELIEVFRSEGKDRVATLVDETIIDPAVRPLYAAIVSSRLQARSVVLDLQDRRPARPTLALVLPCVTLNRPERDTEILCGIYSVDGSTSPRSVDYYGLGDDPAGYELRAVNRALIVSDEHVGRPRKGRDHRALIRERWDDHVGQHGSPTLQDERMERIRSDVAQNKHQNHHHARLLLRAALPIVAEVAPIPAVLLMFADGAVGIHHAYKIHKLASDMQGTEEARRILAEVHDRVDRLDPDRAEALVELLVREYRP